MSTRQQIRAQLRALLDQPSAATSNFTDERLNEFIDQAVKFTGTLIEYPRDAVEVQVEAGVGAYNLPSDFIIARAAYFGNKSIPRDKLDLLIVNEETLKGIDRNWKDESGNSLGRPKYFCILDRKTCFIYPPPDSSESTNGKKLEIVYVYVAPSMNSDADEPDLPVNYQDIVQFYAAHLCYAKLNDKDTSNDMFKQFMAKIKVLQAIVTQETQINAFQWGFSEGLDEDYPSILL